MAALIIYADDDPLDRQVVTDLLKLNGYQAIALDTSQTHEVNQLKTLPLVYGPPAVCILDGHNVLLGTDGNQLVDLRWFGLLSWLHQDLLWQGCRFVLFSNDLELVKQAQKLNKSRFYAALPKGGEGGGIDELLRVVRQALNEPGG